MRGSSGVQKVGWGRGQGTLAPAIHRISTWNLTPVQNIIILKYKIIIYWKTTIGCGADIQWKNFIGVGPRHSHISARHCTELTINAENKRGMITHDFSTSLRKNHLLSMTTFTRLSWPIVDLIGKINTSLLEIKSVPMPYQAKHEILCHWSGKH